MRETPSRPNFIIGGAPKSGTTALANYLRQHSQVFVSDIKEPFYWASDFPAMRQSTGIDSEEKYLELFSAANEQEIASGEGSTLYLYSKCAIEDAVKWDDSLKFVFMIRRPSEIAHAYHMQMRFHEFEDIEPFSDAWQACMQYDHRPGAPRCKEPKLLRYDQVAALGSQLQRASNLIDPSRIHVILFDDFVTDTRDTYRRACEFLGVADDGRSNFRKDNAAMKSRLPQLTRMMRSKPVVATTRFLKRKLAGKMFECARALKHSAMFRNAPRETLDPDFDKMLHDWFRPEVELLEQTLSRNIDAWKTPKRIKAL